MSPNIRDARASRPRVGGAAVSDGAPPGEREVRAFARDVVLGLSDAPRWLPCRYLYDARGSALFEEITRQPEYYLTRTEAAILAEAAPAIREITGPVTVIELGSGSSAKTGLILDAYAGAGEAVGYVAVDVSPTALAEGAARLAARYPGIEVQGIAGTYEAAFPLFAEYSPCLVLFLGSTIGNFNTNESLRFWHLVSRRLRTGDYFLLGVDLVKERELLDAAYNDAAGVTAAFTRNLFARINRELGAAVDLGAIEHVARYNERWQRVEIFARVSSAQRIRVAPLDVTLEVGAGEEIMIEISRKFVVSELRRYLACFGLRTEAVFLDQRRWFAELLLVKAEGVPIAEPEARGG